ncbi:MAG: hypothetical protein GX649_19460 [Chloroflexi bacterium]|nr:hypothetical protein [Chloroflexota bacterium]
MATTRDQFVQSRISEFSQIQGAIEKLNLRAQLVGDDVSHEHHEQMQMLLTMREEAARKIEQIREASSGEWQGAADEVDTALAELEAATRRVVASLKR